MHSNLKTGDHVMIHMHDGEKARTKTRTIVTYVGDVYFTSAAIRYRKTTGLRIWISGPYSAATTDEVGE